MVKDFGALPYGEFCGVVGWEGAIERPVHEGSVCVEPGNPGGCSVWVSDDEAGRSWPAGGVQGGFQPLLGLQVRKGRRPLDDPEFGTGVVHFQQPFCHGLFLAFLGARHFAPLGFFQ